MAILIWLPGYSGWTHRGMLWLPRLFSQLRRCDRLWLGSWKSRNLVPLSFGGWKPKIKVSAEWFLLRRVSQPCRRLASPSVRRQASLVSPDKLLGQPRDLIYIIASVKTMCPLRSPSKAPGARASVSEGARFSPQQFVFISDVSRRVFNLCMDGISVCFLLELFNFWGLSLSVM